MCSIKIPSDVNSVCDTTGSIISYLQNSYGIYNEDFLFDLRVILNELILNAIKHGNGEEINKKVQIVAGIFKDVYVLISVKDEGKGYDCKCLLERNKKVKEIVDLCDMKETGRGLLIVESLCDEMRFNKIGNRITILKRIKY